MSKSEKTLTTATQDEKTGPDGKVADTLPNKRRNFLIGAGLGGIGAAAALVGGVAVEPAGKTGAAPEAQAEGKGYRETEHVRRYYGTTRI
jgi:hypothetical protein